MNYDALDCIQRAIDAMSNEIDFSAWQKNLSETISISLPNTESRLIENLQMNTRTFVDVLLRVTESDTAPLVTACMDVLAERLNDLDYSNMAGQAVNAALKSLETLDEFTEQQEIPLEKALESLADVKSCLPDKAVELIDAKVDEVQTADKKISTSDWIAIIGIIVTIFLFIAGQLSSAEHDQKEEAAWSVLAEYQQESIELQKQDITLKQEILNCLKNQSDVAVETQDASVSTFEAAHERFKCAVDVTDLPDDAQEQETLSEAGSTEN